MNKFVFTQDVEGERSWLANQYPDHEILETIHSGKWFIDYPLSKKNYLLEVAYSDEFYNLDWSTIPGQKIKSVYSSNIVDIFYSKNWLDSDIFIHRSNFSCVKKSNKFLVLNIPRSGTAFCESILSKKLEKFDFHQSVADTETSIKLAETIKHQKLSIFLPYRKDLWGWFTSFCFMKHFIFHWNTFNPSEHNKKISITEQDFINAENLLISTWNFWCNLKCFIPDLDCYLLEFRNMINKYSHLTGHKEIPYNKKELIINYNELKFFYEHEYQQRWDSLTNKGVTHLINMNCKTNLDDLDLSK